MHHAKRSTSTDALAGLWRLVFAATLGVSSPAAPTATPSPAGAPIVRTDEGTIRGVDQHGVQAFLGIPYAKPPVGELRWRPPLPHANWTGTLQATVHGAACPQLYGLGVFAGPPSFIEDCLFLNVVTPKATSGGASAGLPVLFWIHGGGLFDGDSSDYDVTALARQNVVVVTVNYRLGLLGFLAHPALDGAKAPFANYGYLDQQLALRWVQRNIAAFGGDPTRVTIAGQSSGSASTIAHVVSPLAKGLFSRAIFQSGWSVHPSFDYTSLKDAEQQGVAFAKAAGCDKTGDDAAACLRALSVEQVLSLQGTAATIGPYTNAGTGIVDGALVVEQPREAFASGRFNHVPIMNGLTRDENTFFLMVNEYYTGRSLTAGEHEQSVRQAYASPQYPSGTAEKVLAGYPLNKYRTVSEANSELTTDSILCGAGPANKAFAAWVPLYAYVFNDRSAPSYFPSMSFRLGAYHTADILYVFPGYHGGNLGRPAKLTPEQQQLSTEMIRYWANFTRTGNPNGSGDTPWPQYTLLRPIYLSQDIGGPATMSEQEYFSRHQCALWETVTATSQ